MHVLQYIFRAAKLLRFLKILAGKLLNYLLAFYISQPFHFFLLTEFTSSFSGNGKVSTHFSVITTTREMYSVYMYTDNICPGKAYLLEWPYHNDHVVTVHAPCSLVLYVPMSNILYIQSMVLWHTIFSFEISLSRTGKQSENKSHCSFWSPEPSAIVMININMGISQMLHTWPYWSTFSLAKVTSVPAVWLAFPLISFSYLWWYFT